ncbi:DEKNAAC103885 [Brettanomyces naardenensis]|uniref:Transcription factor BYE1 n=1 Tax=Brettanomyces naardenensis TaxID=13370 RepID=A0A448YPH3_BRENA|nr:DEKNAAC103885 [Brettanomyces naardenensis]
MTDATVRRSSRSNKGVNRRLAALAEEAEEAQEKQKVAEERSRKRRVGGGDAKGKIKGKGKGRSNKKQKINEAEEVSAQSEDSVRCLPCGTTDANYDEDNDTKVMIQCDKCKTWQHMQCLFHTENEKKIPKVYHCNVCDPENPRYKNLKLSMTLEEYLGAVGDKQVEVGSVKEELIKGEDIKEESVEEEPAKAQASVASESLEEEEVEAPSPPAVLIPDTIIDDGAKEDKAEDDDYQEENEKEKAPKKHAKRERVKKSATPPVEGLNKTRSSVVKQFAGRFTRKLSSLDKSIVEEDSADEWGRKMEQALYEAFPPFGGKTVSDEYISKSRTLLFNLGKTNLMDKIVKSGFDFAMIVHLTPEEMMREDYKELANEVKKQSMTQTILPSNDEKVKIRRTHRGEEIVEDTEFGQKSVEDARLEEIDRLRDAKERKLKAEREKELEALGMLGVDEEGREEQQQGGHMEFSLPVNNDEEEEETRVDGSEGGAEVSDNRSLDDDDDEFSKILGDEEEKDKVNSGNNQSSPLPTSPQDSDYDPLDTVPLADTVWKGTVEFPGTGVVRVKCMYRCSTASDTHKNVLASKTRKMFSDFRLGPNGLFNAGRLSASTAEDYLAKAIQSRDLYMSEVQPISDSSVSPVEAQANLFNYMKVWSYFYSLGKYGVVDGRPEYVKDCYITCFSREELLNGERVPSFMDYFDRDELFAKMEKEKAVESDEERETHDKKMYILFVAKKNLDYILGKEGFNGSLESIMSELTSY